MADGRDRLAAAQNALLDSLVGGAAPPQGFDPARLHATAATLLAKRADGARRVLPLVAETLGSAYRGEFARYAAGRPRGTGQTTAADAVAFADWAADRRSLPTAVHLEVARAALADRGGGLRSADELAGCCSSVVGGR